MPLKLNHTMFMYSVIISFTTQSVKLTRDPKKESIQGSGGIVNRNFDKRMMNNIV